MVLRFGFGCFRVGAQGRGSRVGGGGRIISDFLSFLQVSEAILDNARLMLQTENIQANAEDFKERLASTNP